MRAKTMSKNHKTGNVQENGDGKLSRKKYEKELERLQAELCALQASVKARGLRVIVVFEGPDGERHFLPPTRKSHHGRHAKYAGQYWLQIGAL
jgi:hypothetical protein